MCLKSHDTGEALTSVRNILSNRHESCTLRCWLGYVPLTGPYSTPETPIIRRIWAPHPENTRVSCIWGQPDMNERLLFVREEAGRWNTHTHLLLKKRLLLLETILPRATSTSPALSSVTYSTKTVTRDRVILHKHFKEQSTHVISE